MILTDIGGEILEISESGLASPLALDPKSRGDWIMPGNDWYNLAANKATAFRSTGARARSGILTTSGSFFDL